MTSLCLVEIYLGIDFCNCNQCDGVEELKEVEETIDAKAGLELEEDLRSKKLKKNQNKEISTSSKGQLISKCLFSVIDSSKIATKIL